MFDYRNLPTHCCFFIIYVAHHFRSAHPRSARPGFDDSNLSQPKRSFIQASRILASISSFCKMVLCFRGTGWGRRWIRISTCQVGWKSPKMPTPNIFRKFSSKHNLECVCKFSARSQKKSRQGSLVYGPYLCPPFPFCSNKNFRQLITENMCVLNLSQIGRKMAKNDQNCLRGQ